MNYLNNIKVLGISFFGTFQAFTELFNPVLSVVISLLTIRYLHVKTKQLKK